MRIDLLLDSRSYGGIETHVYQLAKSLLDHNHNVTVVFFNDYGDHPLKHKLKASKIPFYYLNTSLLMSIKAIADRKPDLLHTHGYKAGFMGRIAAKINRIACCSSFHAGEKTQGRLAFYSWLDRHSAYLANQTIAVSQDIAKTLPSGTQVLNNFVEVPPSFYPGQQIAFVGRLSHEKGVDRFIKASSQLTQNVHIYGEGPMRRECELTAGKNVYFHGQSNMAKHWQNIGLLVMPSRAEGLPLAALEAMSHGIPVIATRVGELPTLIDHEKNGWLITEKTSDIANTIQHWHNLNQQQRTLMGTTARSSIAQGYSSDAMLPQFLGCYHKAMGEY